MLQFNDVEHSFSPRTHIGPLSFRLEAGQTLGMVGPNGSGKTSLLKIAVGLLRPQRGSVISTGGKVVPGQMPLDMGAIIETPTFIPSLTGSQTMKLASNGVKSRISEIPDLLEAAGLHDAAERRVGEYSLGMRQRLAIARSLMGKPRSLILDEPTNGLDPPGIRWFRNLLRDRAAQGCSDIVSTHLLYEVELFATHYLLIDQGTVLSQGDLQDVKDSGATLEDLYLQLVKTA